MRMFHENSRCCYILGNFSGIICFADLLQETLPSVTYQNFLATFVGISKTKRDTSYVTQGNVSCNLCNKCGRQVARKIALCINGNSKFNGYMQHQAFLQICHMVAKATVYQNVCRWDLQSWTDGQRIMWKLWPYFRLYYCEQQTPLPLQAMLVQHRSHPRLFSEQHCFKGEGDTDFFREQNKTKQNKYMGYLFVNRNFMFSLWAIFKTRNGESLKAGIFKMGNL